jgi:hypothetical protein
MDHHIEVWFEASLSSQINVHFKGPVCWFLGIYFHWNISPAAFGIRLSQVGFVPAVLLKYELDGANTIKTPYPSSLFCIDRISKPAIDTCLQSLISCITRLFMST